MVCVLFIYVDKDVGSLQQIILSKYNKPVTGEEEGSSIAIPGCSSSSTTGSLHDMVVKELIRNFLEVFGSTASEGALDMSDNTLALEYLENLPTSSN